MTVADDSAFNPLTRAVDSRDGHATQPDILSVRQMISRISDEAAGKAAEPLRHLFMSGLLGGSYVSFGCLLALAASVGVTTPGLVMLLAGLGLGFSLVLILFSGASLVTAEMGIGFVAVLDGRISMAQYLRMLSMALSGNAIGAFIFVAIAGLAGGPFLGSGYLNHIAGIALGKVGDSVVTTICLAILCTWILDTAAFLFSKVRGNTTKMAFAFYGPYAFVLAGTQHVITSVSFIGFPLMLRAFHPEVDNAALDALAWGFGTDGFLRNIVLVLTGNFIGSTMFGALPFWLLSRSSEKA